jgi:hypothetical protein
VGANTAGFEAVRTYSNLILAAATHKLQASTHNAEAINVLVTGDLTSGSSASRPDVTNVAVGR